MVRRWALITGCSPGGMGEAEAHALVKRGINTVATSIESGDVEYIKPAQGSDDGSLVTMRLDVTDSKSIAAVVEQVGKLTDGKLDYLLNNAGYALYTPLMDADIQQSKKQYDVNVWGVLAMTQAFFPMLRAAKGMVINQGSVSGLQNNNLPYSGVYASSKAAVYSMSAVMRVELAPFDIKVVTLVTSAVQTGFFANKVGGSISKSSAYHPIKAEAENAMSGSSAMGRARDRYEVAEATIAELLQPTPPLFIRKGYYPNVFVWMYWLLPIWVLDMLSRKFGKMDRLAQLLAGADSGKKIN